MSDTGILELEGMTFHAYHGCLESERSEGNTFTVDFRAEIPASAAARSDSLADTLDYSAVYDIVAAQMQVPSNLIEHVAGRIMKALEEVFPELKRFSVRVSKQNPPVAGQAIRSSITLFKGDCL